MINVKYDSSRRIEDGRYFVELVIFDPIDSNHVDKLGYWCDLEHFKVGVASPILSVFQHEIIKEILR